MIRLHHLLAPLIGGFLFACVSAPSADDPAIDDPSPQLLIQLGDTKPAPIQLGAATVGGASPAMVVAVINNRASASGVLHVSVTGADASQFDLTDLFSNCEGVRLAPEAQCSLRIRLRPTSVGAKAASLVIDDGGATKVSLRGQGVASVLSVSPASLVFGAVDVGGQATQVATVTNIGTRTISGLAATATGAGFSVASTTCGTLAPSASCTITARFAPTAAGAATGAIQLAGGGEAASIALLGTGNQPGLSLTLVVGGDAMGEISYLADAGWGTCTSTCSLPVAAGETVSLHAQTPSRFGGWSGACSGADDCTLTITGSVTATARFDRDPGEQWSRRPSGLISAAAFDAAGNLLVAGTGGLQKLDPAGAPVWTVPLTGTVAGLDTDEVGRVFVALQQGTALTVRGFTATGTAMWTRTIAGATAPLHEAFPHALAVNAVNDVVVLYTSGGAGVVLALQGTHAGAGEDIWSMSVPTPVSSLVADTAGNVLVAVASDQFPEQTQVQTFDLGGLLTGVVDPLPGNYDAAIAVGGDGGLVSAVSGHSSLTVARPPSGFVYSEAVDNAANVAHGLDADGAGNAFSVYWRNQNQAPGMVIERFSPIGAITWSLDKPADPFPYDLVGLEPHAVAASGDGRVVVAGYWNGAPWMALYRP